MGGVTSPDSRGLQQPLPLHICEPTDESIASQSNSSGLAKQNQAVCSRHVAHYHDLRCLGCIQLRTLRVKTSQICNTTAGPRLLLMQVVQAAAAAVWGCATSSRTRHLLTDIGAVEALLTMLQKTLTMEAAAGAGGSSPGREGADGLPQPSVRNQLQVSGCCCLGALGLQDKLCRCLWRKAKEQAAPLGDHSGSLHI